MRLTYLSRAAPAHSTGGMEHNSWRLALAMARRGHEVTFITTAHRHSPVVDVSEQHNEMNVLWLGGTNPGQYSEVWFARTTDLMRTLVRNVDIVHSHNTAAFGLFGRDCLNLFRRLML